MVVLARHLVCAASGGLVAEAQSLNGKEGYRLPSVPLGFFGCVAPKAQAGISFGVALAAIQMLHS